MVRQTSEIYGNSEFIKNKRSHLMDKCAHERDIISAKRTKVLLIVLAVSLGFALGGICALSFLYAGKFNVSIPADPVNISCTSETEIANYYRVKERLSSCTEYIRSHACELCEDGWTAHDGKCYFFSSEEQTWIESRNSCEALTAHLVIIDNAKEQEFLASKNFQFHWIGLNDLENEGRWVWVNNQTLEETGLQFWRQSDPDNWKEEDPSGEDCACLRDNTWRDVSCKREINFICEKKHTFPFMDDS